MSFQVIKRSREVCDYIEGVVDTKADIASVETFYSIGSRLTVLDSGDNYVLTSAGWKLMPTTEEKLGKLPREISITAGAHTTLTVEKTATINGDLDDEVELSDGDFVFRGDSIKVTLVVDDNFIGKVFVNGQEMVLSTGVGSTIIGVGDTSIISVAEANTQGEHEQSEPDENVNSIHDEDTGLIAFETNDTLSSGDYIYANVAKSDEDILAYLQSLDDQYLDGVVELVGSGESSLIVAVKLTEGLESPIYSLAISGFNTLVGWASAPIASMGIESAGWLGFDEDGKVQYVSSDYTISRLNDTAGWNGGNGLFGKGKVA